MLGGRYRIVRAIGQGGMGGVYEAVQLDIGSTVAVKLIARQLADEPMYIERFRREAVAAAQLGHPNIVNVTDFQHPPGEAAFLVMEMLQGESLAERIERGGLEQNQAMHIAEQVLDALAAAHANGIVHRDLKPGNVFLVSMGAAPPLVKLVDFGVAKLMDSVTFGRLTKTGVLIGTPRYAAPEQMRDAASVDGRTDVYAAGVLLYCMLSGRGPFLSSGTRLLLDIETAQPPELRSLVPTLDSRLTALVHRAMEKDRAKRFQTAQAFADALESLGALAESVPPPPNALALGGQPTAATRGALPAHMREATTEPDALPDGTVAEPEPAGRPSPEPGARPRTRASRPARDAAPERQRAERPEKPANQLRLWLGLGALLATLLAGLIVASFYLAGVLRGDGTQGPGAPVGELELAPACLQWERMACNCPDGYNRDHHCEVARRNLAALRRGENQSTSCSDWVTRMNFLCDPTPQYDTEAVPIPPPTDIEICDTMARQACTCGSGRHLLNRCARARAVLFNHQGEPDANRQAACERELPILQRRCRDTP